MTDTDRIHDSYRVTRPYSDENPRRNPKVGHGHIPA
jgi:hypothetical protein